MRRWTAALTALLITALAAQAAPPQAPPVTSDFQRLTTHEELVAFMERLADGEDHMRMETIGTSVQGRSIDALYCSLGDEVGARPGEVPVVLIFCQQHGDETSGSEGAMLLARHLAGEGRDLLRNLDLILVPRVNPDGGAVPQRRNASDMDLNRNHMILSEPESRAVHDLFLRWMPEVTMDVHEYGAISQWWMEHGWMIKDADVQVGAVSNPNVDRAVRTIAQDALVPAIGEHLGEQGWSFHEYIVGTPYEGERIRFSTTDVNDGRNSLGIYNTVALIQEGKQYGDEVQYLEKRARSQMEGMVGLLMAVDRNREQILREVSRARGLLDDPRKVPARAALRYDYYPDPQRPVVLGFPMFNLKSWKREPVDLEHFEPQVKVKETTLRPAAYALPGSETRMLKVLERHGVEKFALQGPVEVPVEAARILHVADVYEEEMTTASADVQWVHEVRELPAGTVIVPLDQPASLLLPVMLEVRSTRGLTGEGAGRKYHFGDWLRPDTEYPVLRIPDSAALETLRRK